VLAAIRGAEAWNDAEIANQEAGLADTFKKGGMVVIEPDVESFRKPVLAKVPAMFEAKMGQGAVERAAGAVGGGCAFSQSVELSGGHVHYCRRPRESGTQASDVTLALGPRFRGGDE